MPNSHSQHIHDARRSPKNGSAGIPLAASRSTQYNQKGGAQPVHVIHHPELWRLLTDDSRFQIDTEQEGVHIPDQETPDATALGGPPATPIMFTPTPGAEADALPWGIPFKVQGLDQITVYSDWDAPITIGVEIKYRSPGKLTTDRKVDWAGQWFTLHHDNPSNLDGTLVPRVWQVPAGRVAFRVPVRGVYMRLKVWGGGQGSLYVSRHQDGRGGAS